MGSDGSDDSGNIAAKVQMDAGEFRRFLSDKFKGEIQSAVWGRLTRQLTFGGVVSFGLIVGAATWAWNQVRGQVDSAVKTEVGTQLDQQQRALRDLAKDEAQRAARDAVREDIRNVEGVQAAVRQHIAEQLKNLITEQLRNDDNTRLVQTQVSEQVASLMTNLEWRRQVERAVFAAQARNLALPVGSRLLAFADLVRNPDGHEAGLRILEAAAAQVGEDRTNRAGRQPGPGDVANLQFLRAATVEFAQRLERPAFATYRQLLADLLALAEPGTAGDVGFAVLIEQFQDPITLAWLVREARNLPPGAPRDAAFRGLVSLDSADARERVDSLMCAESSQFTSELLRAVSADPQALRGDAAGGRFMQMLTCIGNNPQLSPLAEVEPQCLPGGGLVGLWRLSVMPPDRPGTRRARAGFADDLAAQRVPRATRCGAGQQELRRGLAGFAGGSQWLTLRPAATPPGGQANTTAGPLDPFLSLLPDSEGTEEPQWLVALAHGQGAIADVAVDPQRHLLQIAVILRRLATAERSWTSVEPVRHALIAALVDALGPSIAGNQAERVLLAAMHQEGLPQEQRSGICTQVLEALADAAQQAAVAPAAVAGSVQCLARAGRDTPWARHVVELIARLPDGPVQGASIAGLLDVLSVAVGGTEANAAAMADWLLRLPEERAPDAALARAMAIVRASVANVALAGALEGDPARLGQVVEGMHARPRTMAELVAILPYLAPDFAGKVPPHPRVSEQLAGRYWTRITLDGSQRLLLPPGSDGVQMLGLGSGSYQELLARAVRFRDLYHGFESETAPAAGTYAVAARTPEAVAALQVTPQPQPYQVFRNAVRARDAPVPLGRTLAAEIPANTREGLFFAIDLRAGQTVMIETFALSGDLDTTIEFFDPAGHAIADDDDSGKEGSPASFLCRQVEADGLHALRVSNFGGAQPTAQSFEFRVTLAEHCPS